MAQNSPEQTVGCSTFDEFRERVEQVRASSAQAASNEFMDRCVELATEGDVGGLLVLLRRRPVAQLTHREFNLLVAAIRQLQTDPQRLGDAVIAEIVGFAFVLLLRVQLGVELRLEQMSRPPGRPIGIPQDLDDQGEILHVERISRFLVEVLAAQARITHVRKIESKAKGSNGHVRSVRPRRDSVAENRIEDAGRSTTPGNGRLRNPQESYPFT